MDKYWRNSMFILGLTVLALSLCGACYGESQKFPIQDRREAIAIANQVTGFDKLANFSDVIITARQVVIEEDDTVLSEWIQGRSLWKVSYVNVILPRTEIAEPLEKIKAFDVFVDTETGIVPKLVSQRIPDLKYRKWIHKFQEEMKQRLLSKKKSKKQFAMPEVPSKISFLVLYKDALIYPDDEYIEVVYIYDFDDNDDYKGLIPTLFFNRYGPKPISSGPGSSRRLVPTIRPENPSVPARQTKVRRDFSDDFISYRRIWINAETGLRFRSEGGRWRINPKTMDDQ